ncbi:MAG: CehA/McbA family metallohydrolase [Anaerolineales bacterium]
MALYERVGNVHIHTIHSDGTGDYRELADVANDVGLDYLIVTDHNSHTQEKQGWYGEILVLTGEEIHDPAHAMENHYLVFGANHTMAPYAGDPQRLIDAVQCHGGLGFIAHPYEQSGRFIGEPEINWNAWHAEGYEGLEIWNYMSEFKSYLNDPFTTLLYALIPRLAIRGPYPETLHKWDELLADAKIWAIGGSDAHGKTYRMGPFKRQVFGYRHLFQTVNTHALLSDPWSGDVSQDAPRLYTALGQGRSFIGYDALAPTRGFRFYAQHGTERYTMGDEITAPEDVRFEVSTPSAAHLRLIHNGSCVAESEGHHLTYTSRSPGAYRVEALKRHLLVDRGWIYSNPIFVTA